MFACTRLALAVLLIGVARPATAHFVWVEVTGATGDERQAKVYFSETPEPGAAHLVDRLQRTEAWSCDSAGKAAPLSLSAWSDEAADVGGLSAKLPADGASCAALNCLYGVFQRGETSLLLNYYARYQRGAASAKCPADLALDLSTTESADGAAATVTWQGQPLPNAEVTVTAPDDETRELKTDNNGSVNLGKLQAGRYAIRARHVEADKAGELDGKAYTQAWHIATLTLDPADADRSATQVLSDARQNRAVWEHFPGFRAKLLVSLDGQQREGTMLVTPDGDVNLKGFDDFGRGFVDRHLKSLVMHRMPGPQFEDDGASFEADDQHVLGRKLRLAEAAMGSVYRIKDNVVTEVNRTMGKQHFTISVIDVEYNAENQYLPHIFTVSFWDQEGGNLKSVESVYHQWTRIEKFDLPAKVVVVATADNDKREVLQIAFSDLQLLDSSPSSTVNEQAQRGN